MTTLLDKPTFGAAANLFCRECGATYDLGPGNACEQCFGPYEVEYDYAAMKGKVTRESIAKGPKSLWRYRDLLPVDKPVTGDVVPTE